MRRADSIAAAQAGSPARVTQDAEAIARHDLPSADPLKPLLGELATQIPNRGGRRRRARATRCHRLGLPWYTMDGSPTCTLNCERSLRSRSAMTPLSGALHVPPPA